MCLLRKQAITKRFYRLLEKWQGQNHKRPPSVQVPATFFDYSTQSTSGSSRNNLASVFGEFCQGTIRHQSGITEVLLLNAPRGTRETGSLFGRTGFVTSTNVKTLGADSQREDSGLRSFSR